MNKTIIENIIKLLQRVELKWNEVPIFIECINFLTGLAKEEEKDIIKSNEDNNS